MTLILLPIETPLVTVKSQTTNGQNLEMILLSPCLLLLSSKNLKTLHTVKVQGDKSGLELEFWYFVHEEPI